MVETTIWREWEHDPMLKTCVRRLGSVCARRRSSPGIGAKMTLWLFLSVCLVWSGPGFDLDMADEHV